MVVRLFIERRGFGSRGPRFDAIGDRDITVRDSCDPEHDGARAFAMMGIFGQMQTYVGGSPSMNLDIASASDSRVVDGPSSGLRRIRYLRLSNRRSSCMGETRKRFVLKGARNP